MSDGVNFTVFPTWDRMDFTQDCKLYGNWLSTFLQPNPWQSNETLDGSAWLIVNYFTSALPDNYNFPDEEVLGSYLGTVLDWYGWNLYNSLDNDSIWMTDDFYNNVLMGPSGACRPQYCKALGYTGNMDLTGIGVFVAYYVEAILATMYLFAFTLRSIRQHRAAGKQEYHSFDENQLSPGPDGKKRKRLRLGSRAMGAVKGSLDTFLNATVFFSLVMLAAALYISAERTVERKTWQNASHPIPSGSALYDLVLSLLASTFSVFPVTILYAMQTRRGSWEALRTGDRQVWIRWAVLALIWALAAAEVFLSPTGEYDYSMRHSAIDEDAVVDINCDQRGGIPYWHGVKAAQFLIIGAPLLWLFLTLFVITGFRIPGVVDRPWVSRWRSSWRLVVAWVNMLFMWGVLAYFTHLRHKINVTAGHLDSEDEWTFGQILALSTWAPVVVEFIHVFIWGIEEGRSGSSVQQTSIDGEPASGSSDKSKELLTTIRSLPSSPPPLKTPDANVELTDRPRTQTYFTPTGDVAPIYTIYEPHYYYQIPRVSDHISQQQVRDQWQRSGW